MLIIQRYKWVWNARCQPTQYGCLGLQPYSLCVYLRTYNYNDFLRCVTHSFVETYWHVIPLSLDNGTNTQQVSDWKTTGCWPLKATGQAEAEASSLPTRRIELCCEQERQVSRNIVFPLHCILWCNLSRLVFAVICLDSGDTHYSHILSTKLAASVIT